MSEQKLRSFYTAHRDEVRPVLFEDSDSDGSICGFTDNYIRVELPYDRTLANRIVPVRLGTINENDNLNGTIEQTQITK